MPASSPPSPDPTGTSPFEPPSEVDPAPITLWPHQAEALDAARKHFPLHNRVHDVMACGTGKTLVGAALASAEAPHGRVLFVVPRINLIAQAIADHRRLGDTALGRVVIVCGDTRELHDTRLAGLPMTVTTDPAQIAQLVASAKGRVTVFSTYPSACKALVRSHADHGLAEWDLVQFDEAHHMVGVGAWAALHSTDHLPAARRRYTTATKRVLSKHLSGDTQAASMNDPAVFGVRSYELGFSTARKRGLLAPFRVVAPVITDEQVRELWERAEKMTLGETVITADDLAVQIAALKAMREFGVHRGLSFHARVASALQWAATLPQAARLLEGGSPDVRARHLNSTHSGQHRRRAVSWFSAPLDSPGQRRVLTNVRLFREGFNAPACDTVILTHRTTSVVDLIQMLSRALRIDPAAPDKTATFIIPIRVSGATTLEDSLDTAGWESLWQALRALGSMSDGLSENAIASLRRRGAGTPDEDQKVPSWLHVRGVEVPDGFARAIGHTVMRTIAPSVQEYLGAARAFAGDHGHLKIPVSHKSPSGLRLGAWLSRMRKAYRDEILSSEVALELDELGVDWDPIRARWGVLFAAAAAYAKANGNLRVPPDHVTADGFRLGAGLKLLRQAEQRGTFTAEELARWESLGMVWRPKTDTHTKWIRAARAYREEHGDLLVPSDYVSADGQKLGLWIMLARKRFHAGTLTPSKIRDWQALDMVWDAVRHKQERMLAACAEYVQRHGHLNVPNSYTVDDLKLGMYLGRLRARNRRSELTAATVKEFTKAGMQWETPKHPLAATYKDVEDYYRAHGHLAVLGSYITPEGIQLGKFLSYRRRQQAAGLLPAGEEEWLNARGISWSTAELGRVHRVEMYWERGFGYAQRHHTRHGTAWPKAPFVEDDHGRFSLRQWLQRQLKTFDQLTAAKKQRLQSIGVEPPDRREAPRAQPPHEPTTSC